MLFFLLSQKERQGLSIIFLKNDTGIELLNNAFLCLLTFPLFHVAFNKKKNLSSSRKAVFRKIPEVNFISLPISINIHVYAYFFLDLVSEGAQYLGSNFCSG